ncbi:hypothetical protein CPB83DRAFT_866636 [Crepidotus variabilis]|uniref:DUF6570 domain-containing protein n=1 Tax=Crepidotus variabilis TaxID=179855 RepID=A0A9P6ETM7_9AGAR|nr:hypothetical protein CPB83DRAFT_866636 [Crepidotus variabilis]
MLIARVRHTCAYVKVASGQCKMKANVVAFEAPVQKVYNMLPPPREDLDDPTPEDFKRTPLLIRKNTVLRALRWLTLNHADYADLQISEVNLASYSEECPPVSVEYRQSATNKVPEGTSVFDQEVDDGTEEGQCPFAVHGLTAETWIPWRLTR